MSIDGACDISAVKHCVEKFNAEVFIIKSTVAVGATDYLTRKYRKPCVFYPEYCGESSYDNTYSFHTEAVKTPFIILGGDNESVRAAYNMLLPVVGPQKKWFFLSTKEAEMAKYMENTFFAMKITYCNEIYNICEVLGVDWHKAREAWLADPRINPMHTAVFADKRGFGGKCLPKDLAALIHCAKQGNYSPQLLYAIWHANNDFTRQNEN
jgi:nucleotide sugar dehydrogenase